MDTNHVYPEEYDLILHFLDRDLLRRGFLFVVDDPTHSGTDSALQQFLRERSDEFKILTSAEKNLWWFFRK